MKFEEVNSAFEKRKSCICDCHKDNPYKCVHACIKCGWLSQIIKFKQSESKIKFKDMEVDGKISFSLPSCSKLEVD